MDSNRGPSAYQPNALPLGQTGSRAAIIFLSGESFIICLSSRAYCSVCGQSSSCWKERQGRGGGGGG